MKQQLVNLTTSHEVAMVSLRDDAQNRMESVVKAVMQNVFLSVRSSLATQESWLASDAVSAIRSIIKEATGE